MTEITTRRCEAASGTLRWGANSPSRLLAALLIGMATLPSLAGEPPQNAAGPAYDTAGHQRRPTGATYHVRRLPHADMRIDGRLDEPEWSRANVERHFVFPWSKEAAPATEFRAFCDDQYLYFAFRAQDADIFVLDKLRDKEDAVFEDRVEMILSRDEQMRNYFCFEIDSRGRVFDYRARYYRQFDPTWKCQGLKTAAAPFRQGYVVEGRMPLRTLREMGFPQLVPGGKILCGLYRAEFSHDRSGKPVVQRETIHNRGRKLAGPPPIEGWMSWVDPKTPEPDFHVPSSLGWLDITE
jgi:hypothetical protein